MNEIVDLKPALIEDDELIENLARFADGTLSEAQVKARHRLSDKDWLAMGENDDLVRAIEAAKLRRIRAGTTKRERAQIEILDGPPILGKILRDPGSNARHVIDAVKTLDTLATNGAEAAAAGARFEIFIDLGGDHVEHYSKSIAIDPNDTPPDDDRSALQRPAVAAYKSWDGGDAVAAPAEMPGKKPVKTIERKAGRRAERKSAEEIALESFLNMSME